MTTDTQAIPAAAAAPEEAESPRRGTARQTWPVAIGELRENLRHCRQTVQKLLPDCFLWAIQHQIPRNDFAAAVGISPNTLWKVLKGTYTHPQSGEKLDLSAAHEDAMRQWLAEQRAAWGATYAEGEFVMTPTAQRVFSACRLARESHTPVFLSGPSQIGKTWALRYDAEANNHGATPYIRCPSVGGFYAFQRAICDGLGVAIRGNREHLKREIIRAMRPDQCLIFDEFHELMHTARGDTFIICAEFVRELFDRVGCGIVLSMTLFGRDKMVAHRHAELEQIFRRGVHRVVVGTENGQPLREDIESILAFHGLDMPPASLICTVDGHSDCPRKVLVQLSREEGLLAITERLRYARKLASRARGDDAAVTWDDWTRAHLLIRSNAHPAPDWR